MKILTLRFDLLHAKQAVETLFFHGAGDIPRESPGGLPSGVGPGAMGRYCEGSVISPDLDNRRWSYLMLVSGVFFSSFSHKGYRLPTEVQHRQ